MAVATAVVARWLATQAGLQTAPKKAPRKEKKIVRIGSRKSQLAMIQTHSVLDSLRRLKTGHTFEIITMETKGDKILDVALSKIGSKSLFTGELECLLAAKEVDLIVHSLKDLPTTLPEGLALGGICEREDPRDSVIFRKDLAYTSLSQLPDGAVVGTSSLRRIAQIVAKYPKLQFESVRGNLNTRLRKLDVSTNDGKVGSRYSALVLAAAGVIRMGWQDRIGEYLEKDTCLHAVGQGSIGLECREDDSATRSLLEQLTDFDSAVRCYAERAFMKALEGGCSVPLGVWTEYSSGMLLIIGSVHSLDGKTCAKSQVHRAAASLEDAAAVGSELAQILVGLGAKDILAAIPRVAINQAPK